MSRATATALMGALIDEWLASREAVREIERAEHPDITDVLGRVWVWKGGTLYTHDSMAWPRDFIVSPDLKGPTQRALDNPNYQWCDICKAAGGTSR